MKILHKFTVNWADEADFDGFEVVDMEEWKARKKIFDLIDEDDFEGNIGLGSNEDEDYYKDDLEEYVKLGFETTKITDEEAAVIDKYFGSDSGPNLWLHFIDTVLWKEEDEFSPKLVAAVKELYSDSCDCSEDEE